MKSRLEELKGQINQKEEEVRTKEKYLQQKMEELRLREQGLIAEDIEAREQDLQGEGKQQKVKLEILFPSLDRKSTRLNSSHDQISYAGFCLKKKKKKKYYQHNTTLM